MAESNNNLRTKIIAGIMTAVILWAVFDFLTAKPKTQTRHIEEEDIYQAQENYETAKTITNPPVIDTSNVEMEIYNLKSEYPLNRDIFLTLDKARKINPQEEKSLLSAQTDDSQNANIGMFTLSGVSKKGDSFYALIGEKIVTVGDTIMDAEILEINEDFVLIERLNEKVRLEMEEK